MGHENYHRHVETRGSSDRVFGFVFAIVFLIIGLYPLVDDRPVRLWGLALAAMLAVAALLVPRLLASANRLWTRLGLLLHRIVSPVALGIMFFLVITPIALLMRLRGKDPLRLRFAPDLPSYWIDRLPPGPKAESLKDQF